MVSQPKAKRTTIVRNVKRVGYCLGRKAGGKEKRQQGENRGIITE